MNDPKVDDRRARLWTAWTATLSPQARAALAGLKEEPDALAVPLAGPADDEAATDYAGLRGRLSPIARDDMDALVDQPEVEEEANSTAARYCLVECRDGEWATVHMLKTAEGLARKIDSLDGQDIAVWAFYGIPLPVTKGDPRFVFLQDGRTAVQVPTYEGGPVRRVDVDLLSGKALEEIGYLGPPELLEPAKVFQTAGADTEPEDDELDDEVPDDDEE